MSPMCIVIIKDGEADESVFILEFSFFKHLVEELGDMRRGIAEGSTS